MGLHCGGDVYILYNPFKGIIGGPVCPHNITSKGLGLNSVASSQDATPPPAGVSQSCRLCLGAFGRSQLQHLGMVDLSFPEAAGHCRENFDF